MDNEIFIVRQIEKILKEDSGKAKIIIGPRQIGKTTIVHQVFDKDEKVIWFDGDEPDDISTFENITSTRLRNLIGGNRTVIIDEAQKISNIGNKLKLITDKIKNVNLIVTGSSSFEITNQVTETLTGRKQELHLFPLSFKEMVDHTDLREELRMLPQRLLYGYYPEVVTSPGREKKILSEIVNSYLFKDILMWNRIQKSDKLMKLLQALAFQVGNEVSYTELAKTIGLKSDTVESYITILERAFIVFRLGAFNRNLRKELKRNRKIYFYDLGVRNALISNFRNVDMREDVGKLWENYCIAERIKHIHYNDIYCSRFFWRTTDQQEIDYIEQRDGFLYAYEFKWNDRKKVKIPKIFTTTYHDSESKIISRDNYERFLGF